MLPPLQFVPFLRPMVWGGRRLATKLGKHLPDDQRYGESWEVSDHPLHRSVVASGPLAGTTLRQLMETRRDELLGAGTNHTTFPLLVKYLDCADWLSMQVHPDEEAVKKLWPGEGSKTEAWFVIDADPGSRIYAGLKPGVGEREMRAALQTGTVAECLHSFEPKPGDCVFLPAGTVHAVGGGVLLAEVQQTSDATFRLFDWNRRDAQGNTRQLHIEEGLASIHWDQGPVLPIAVPEFTESADEFRRRISCPANEHHSCQLKLITCTSFELTFVRGAGLVGIGEPTTQGATVLLVLTGSDILDCRQGKQIVAAGQVWLLPSPASHYQPNFFPKRPPGWSPSVTPLFKHRSQLEFSALICRLPD